MNDTDPSELGPASRPTLPPRAHDELDLAEMIGRLVAAVVRNTDELEGMHETLKGIHAELGKNAERNESTHQIFARGILQLHEDHVSLDTRLEQIENLPPIKRALGSSLGANGGSSR